MRRKVLMCLTTLMLVAGLFMTPWAGGLFPEECTTTNQSTTCTGT